MSKAPPLLYVIKERKNMLGNYPGEAYFYLERDNWNDFSFYTSYSLHSSKLTSIDGVNSIIGHLKILKQGQNVGEQNLLPLGPLDSLNEEFCSMANSLDYYERISQLSEKFRDRLLFALRDCIIFQEIFDEFKGEQGFKKSLMRGIKSNDEIFDLGPLLISRNFERLMDQNLSFGFSMPGLEKPIEFRFDSPSFGWPDQHLPNRIAVIIGRNGSGKSTLLSRISRIAFASTVDRKDVNLKKVGVIYPQGLGFPRIVLLSYSAFDSFAIPGIYKKEKEIILKEMENGLGRYVYCGIRDIIEEIRNSFDALQTDENGKLLAKDIIEDRIANPILKPISLLSDEFVRNIKLIEETERMPMLNMAVSLLRKEKSMYDVFPDDFEIISKRSLKQFFEKLSTGHKFVFHAVTSIIANTTARSILLFDEPETHLHPPILASLMMTIRFILDKLNAFMIVSTHSPVILQETLRQHVYVLEREDNIFSFYHPELETFGENVGILTKFAFGLTAETSDYHNTLNQLIEEFGNYPRDDDFEQRKSLEKIESFFPEGLSMQARSYVLSKLYKK